MRIVEKDYPFRIREAKAKNGKHIRIQLSEFSDGEQRGYVLKVYNMKNEPGRYYDIITLKTDSKIRPMINIQVVGNIIEKTK